VDASANLPTYQSGHTECGTVRTRGAIAITAGVSYSGGETCWSETEPRIPMLFRWTRSDSAISSMTSFQPFLASRSQYKGFDVYNSYPRGRYQRDSASAVRKRASKGSHDGLL